jgi:hypothetical protein
MSKKNKKSVVTQNNIDWAKLTKEEFFDLRFKLAYSNPLRTSLRDSFCTLFTVFEEVNVKKMKSLLLTIQHETRLEESEEKKEVLKRNFFKINSWAKDGSLDRYIESNGFLRKSLEFGNQEEGIGDLVPNSTSLFFLPPDYLKFLISDDYFVFSLICKKNDTCELCMAVKSLAFRAFFKIFRKITGSTKLFPYLDSFIVRNDVFEEFNLESILQDVNNDLSDKGPTSGVLFKYLPEYFSSFTSINCKTAEKILDHREKYAYSESAKKSHNTFLSEKLSTEDLLKLSLEERREYFDNEVSLLFENEILLINKDERADLVETKKGDIL